MHILMCLKYIHQLSSAVSCVQIAFPDLSAVTLSPKMNHEAVAVPDNPQCSHMRELLSIHDTTFLIRYFSKCFYP